MCNCKAHWIVGAACVCKCTHPKVFSKLEKTKNEDPITTQMVAEVSPVTGELALISGLDVDQTANFLEYIGQLARERRNYLLVNVTVSPADI